MKTAKPNPARDAARKLASELAHMSTEDRAAMADQMGCVVSIEGRALSPLNAVLALTQQANATVCGGFRQWLAAGRQVRKGETALWIFAPSVRKGADAQEGEQSSADRTRFVMVPVFDVSQTDATEANAEVAA